MYLPAFNSFLDERLMGATEDSHSLVGRTGHFTPDDPDRCAHYALFLRDLTRAQADGLFFFMFILVMGLLITASAFYTKASKTLNQPVRVPSDNLFRRQVRMRCLLISIACFFVALICVPMEALALLSIQFCDGEDLMMLYWGFWNLMQFGSLIAIFGIAFYQFLFLGGGEQPPWNISLGTPVLLTATIGHAVRTYLKGVLKKRRAAKLGSARDLEPVDTPPVPLSTNPRARHVGYTLDNEMLFALPRKEPNSADGSQASEDTASGATAFWATATGATASAYTASADI